MTVTKREREVAFLVNLAAWGQLSKWTFGAPWPGIGASLLSMISAEKAGSIEKLPQCWRPIVQVLTLPGSIAVGELDKPCCEGCAKNTGCDSDIRED